METIDLLCSDYERAAANRQMVRLKQNIEGYLFIEALIRSWPRKKPLPAQLLGYILSVGGHEGRELSGFHRVDNL